MSHHTNVRPHREAPGLVRRQKEWEKNMSKSFYCGFHRKNQWDTVSSWAGLELDSLNNCSELLVIWGKAMAPHFSTLAWRILWMEEPGGLQSRGSLRVWQDWVTSLSLLTFMPWKRKQKPTPVFLPGESQGWQSLVGCRLWGHTESDTTEVTWQQQLGYVSSFYLSGLIADPGMIEGRGSGALGCRSLTIWDKWEFELEMGWLHIKDIFASKNYAYKTKTKLLKSS